MSTILLPIKPVYVEKILNNTKKYEYRKTFPKKKVDKIIIYSSSPVKKVVGEAEVLGVLSDNKEKIWHLTKDYSGIDKTFFDKYYKDKKDATAYKLGKVTIYDKPKELIDYNINYSPQSFVYLD